MFRVATYNVHACVGPDGRHDPTRVAAVIAELDADIVALQEFSYPADIALETRTPVVLTELDTYECALGPARQNPTHCFGNVILTRHRLREVHRIDLSVLNREPRGALAATIDAGGCCRIVGRCKDMIIRGGENIYPAEIEQQLYRHPAVEQVAVFGVPDEKFGEIVCAWIVARAGQSVSAEELAQYCRSRIAHYKVPAHIRLVEQMPATVTGKLQKYLMRQTMAQQLGIRG
jgi:hypothetical protein